MRNRLISCQGKKQFLTFTEAERNLINIKKATSSTSHMTIYPCRFCNHFHIGNGSEKDELRLPHKKDRPNKDKILKRAIDSF